MVVCSVIFLVSLLVKSRLSSQWRHVLCYVESEFCLLFANAFSYTFARRGTSTMLLKGMVVPFFRNVCFHLFAERDSSLKLVRSRTFYS